MTSSFSGNWSLQFCAKSEGFNFSWRLLSYDTEENYSFCESRILVANCIIPVSFTVSNAIISNVTKKNNNHYRRTSSFQKKWRHIFLCKYERSPFVIQIALYATGEKYSFLWKRHVRGLRRSASAFQSLNSHFLQQRWAKRCPLSDNIIFL